MTHTQKLLLLLVSNLFHGLGSAAFSFITTWAVAAFGVEAVVVKSLLQIVPSIVLSLLGGVLADRFDPRWPIFLSQAVYALNLVYIAATPLDSPTPIYAVVLASSLIGAISAPASSTLVPLLFEKEQYMRVNARLNLASDIAFLAAPLAAGYLQSLEGPRPAALTAALLILLSALALLWLPRLPRQRAARLNLAYVSEGLAYAGQNRALLSVLFFWASPTRTAPPFTLCCPSLPARSAMRPPMACCSRR